ncbi:MAG TPA: hypothetical protein VIN02_03500 [Sulfurovum sp.]
MKKLIKPFLTVFVLFILSGCATSDLSYKNDNIHLRINDASLQVHGVTLQEKHDNFSTLFLTQRLLRLDDGSMAVFEDARTDMQFQFDQTTPRSIKIIFDAKSVLRVHYNTFIYAFQVILKDNRVLNVLVAQGYNQELQMLYGMSTEKMNDMLKELGQDAKPAFYKNVIDLSSEPSPYVSRWTVQKVHLAPLVVPVPRFGRL